MALILNIEVSGKAGFVSLAKDGRVIETITNENPMEHAAFLQPAIKQLTGKSKFSKNSIEAIALSNGPGSYTGLRVGLASAKGLAFSLNLPLITINTLQLMAMGAGMKIEQGNSINNNNRYFPIIIDEVEGLSKDEYVSKERNGKEFLICPLVDARRMEVFFGLYTYDNEVIIPPSAVILDESFLKSFLENKAIIFTGSGAEKLETIVENSNAYFLPQKRWDTAFGILSYNFFRKKKFADIDLAEPFYCKEFYDTTARG